MPDEKPTIKIPGVPKDQIVFVPFKTNTATDNFK
jgi:hypothetical protein